MVIDAHQHFWKYDPVKDSWITDEMSVIKRNFLPADLKPILQKNKVDGCVAVQADQSDYETEFLISLTKDNLFIKGVVGWVDLRANNLEEKLAYFSGFPVVKGFRHIVQGEPKGFLLNPKFIQGVRKLAKFNFTYDLLVYHHQLEEAIAFVRQLPEVKIVIDHIAKPSIKTKEKTHWELNMAAIGTLNNVHCKISGMVTEADWKNIRYDDFEPYLDEVFEIFGTKRLMYGSDWPVCLLAASYEQQFSIVQQYISKLSAAEKQQVLGENAETFYNL